MKNIFVLAFLILMCSAVAIAESYPIENGVVQGLFPEEKVLAAAATAAPCGNPWCSNPSACTIACTTPVVSACSRPKDLYVIYCKWDCLVDKCRSYQSGDCCGYCAAAAIYSCQEPSANCPCACTFCQ